MSPVDPSRSLSFAFGTALPAPKQSRRALAAPRFGSSTVCHATTWLEGLGGPVRGRVACCRNCEKPAERLAYISEFIEEAKTSGVIQRAIGGRNIIHGTPPDPAPRQK